MICDWITARYKICEAVLNDDRESKARKSKAEAIQSVLEELDIEMRAVLAQVKKCE
jgi:hypothetical protein